MLALSRRKKQSPTWRKRHCEVDLLGAREVTRVVESEVAHRFGLEVLPWGKVVAWIFSY